MQNRETQRLLHTKQNKGKTGVGIPSDREGSDGDIWVRQINGKTTLCAKYNNTWRKFTEDTLSVDTPYANSSISANGYITFSNGLIIQWGQTAAGANAYSADTDFPIAFPNNVFSLVGSKSDKESGASDGNDAGIKYVSLSKFKVYSDDNAETINWIAIGN